MGSWSVGKITDQVFIGKIKEMVEERKISAKIYPTSLPTPIGLAIALVVLVVISGFALFAASRKF